MSDSCDPMDYPAKFLCPWDFPGSTGVDCHFLLQEIFLTQGSNPASGIAVRLFPTEPPRKPPAIFALAPYRKDAFDVVDSCRGHNDVSENPSIIRLFGLYAQSNNCSWNTSVEPRSCICRRFPVYLPLHRGNLKRLLKWFFTWWRSVPRWHEIST